MNERVSGAARWSRGISLLCTAVMICAIAGRVSATEQENAVKIRMIIADRVLEATLDDNASARDFVSLLPLELELEDYAATEKIAYPPRRLSEEGAPRSYVPRSGDITYFAPWGNLALFHRDFRDSPGLIRLGEFDGDIDVLRKPGRLNVRFELAR